MPADSQDAESPLVRFRSLRLTQNNLISLGIGVVVGLALGLLIGWVWWPVEWQGAGLGELNRPGARRLPGGRSRRVRSVRRF